MANKKDTKSYHVDGLSCANCAKKFEKNVQSLAGVNHAEVNFGAGKITVEGTITIEQIEKAGAFENIKVIDTKQEPVIEKKVLNFFKRNWNVLLAIIFILSAFLAQGLGTETTLSMGLFAVAILVGGYKLFFEGIKNLLKFEFTMATLMTVAIIGAVIIGEWTEGAVVVVLFALSEALERYSMDKARNSIRSLIDIAPKEALIRRNGTEQLIAVKNIQLDDLMLVKPGQKIAMDGLVEKGLSTVNQASITGESIPVEKKVNDEVFAGTLNEAGFLEIRVTKKSEDTTLAKIIHLVEEAQGKRAPAQAFVDTFAKYYTPAIIILSLLIIFIPPVFFGGEWATWVYQGLSVLVVGCPCSLVISTPVSIVSAIGNSAKHGVLVKGGIYLEEIGQMQAIAFDKTGTLTTGKPKLTDFINYSKRTDEEVFREISALESYSQHPLAAAVLEEANRKKIDFQHLSIVDFQSITGKGLKGTLNHQTYYVGSPIMFSEMNILNEQLAAYEALEKQGKTVVLFGTKTEIIALVAIADELREESHEVIKQIHELGIKHSIMLSGDNQNTVDYIGKLAGVTEVVGELMPADKLTYVKELQRKFGKVAMIGDGVNDAPALASASVGIAMAGAGTDTALETADIALMSDDLKRLPFVIELSRKTLKIIKQNITFSLAIKLAALLLVIPGWLTLWIAIVADMGATLLVTLNGLRLMKYKP